MLELARDSDPVALLFCFVFFFYGRPKKKPPTPDERNRIKNETLRSSGAEKRRRDLQLMAIDRFVEAEGEGIKLIHRVIGAASRRIECRMQHSIRYRHQIRRRERSLNTRSSVLLVFFSIYYYDYDYYYRFRGSFLFPYCCCCCCCW